MPVQITIEQLPAAEVADAAHALPATKDGSSVRLSVQQLANVALAQVRDGAPVELDTLAKIVAAIGADPTFAATVAAALATKAPLASPVLSGVPTAPTAAPGTTTTQVATTAFVAAAASARKLLSDVVFRAGRTTNWTCVSGAQTVIPGRDTSLINVGGHYSTSTGRFTAPKAGLYLFQATLLSQLTAVGGTYFGASLMVNGASARVAGFSGWTSGHYVTASCIGILELQAGDYVEPAYQSSAVIGINSGINFEGIFLGTTS